MASRVNVGTATVLRHCSGAEDCSLKDVTPCRLINTSGKIATLSSQDSGSPRRLACL